MSKNHSNVASFAGLLFVAFWIAGCGPTPPSPETAVRKMEIAGIVRGLNPAETSVIVEHEDVPGFMPSMTMPFRAKSIAAIQGLAVGDAIRFELIVTADDSWIEQIRPISSSEVTLPAAPTATPTASTTDRVREGDALPDFQLVDQQGRAISADTFAGQPLVLTFIFTRCPVPNFCPLMSEQFAELEAEIQADPALADRTRLLSVSFDPDFDTPAVLADYAANFTDDGDLWRFATGEPSEIENLTQAFSVFLAPDGESIDHGLSTALVDADGTVRKIWRGNGWKPAEVIAELKSLPAPTPENATSFDPHQGASTTEDRNSTASDPETTL